MSIEDLFDPNHYSHPSAPPTPIDAEPQQPPTERDSQPLTSSEREVLTLLAQESSRLCRRCKAALPEDRDYVCEACESVNTFLAEQVEERKREAELTERFDRSGLPAAYRLDRRNPRTWLDVAKNIDPADLSFFETLTVMPRGGLFLWGSAGTFKTSAAASLLARAIAGDENGGVEGRFCYVPEMFTELYDIYAANDGRSRKTIVGRYAYRRWLVIDDLGKEKPSEHGAAVINEILNARYSLARSTTIITSNYDLTTLEARFRNSVGEEWSRPIARRIEELCISIPMEKRP